MKKLLTSPRFLHGFYGSVVILLLGYIYLTNVPNEKSKSWINSLHQGNEITQGYSTIIRKNWDRYASAYINPLNRNAQIKNDQIYENTTIIYKKIDSISSQFTAFLNKKSFFSKKTSLATRSYFSKNDIDLLQNEVQNFYFSTLENINDKEDKEEFKQKIDTLYFREFSQNFRDLPANAALLELEQVASNILKFDLELANYIAIKFGSCVDIKFDKFLLGIYPTKERIYKGEVFSAIIAPINYASYFGNNLVSLEVDGKPLSFENGIAKLEMKSIKVGKQTIIAVAKMRNIETGVEETFSRDFTFEVLPK